MTRIALIDGHPDPAPHFVHALADAYAEGAAGRHELRRVTIADLDFPMLRAPRDWQEGELPPSLAEAQQAIGWAEHLVLVYPLWLGDVPGLFKGFLEQVARPGFAIGRGAEGLRQQLLGGRSARVVVTMGMPAAFYRLWFGAHSLKSLKYNILEFVGIKPVRTTLIGTVDAGAERRERWLDRMRELGRRGG